MTENGYQSTETGIIDRLNPPKQDSGVPRKCEEYPRPNHKSMKSKEILTGKLPETPTRPPNTISTTIQTDRAGTYSEHEVTKFGTGAHVIVPKRLEGKTVFIIEPDEV